MDYKHIRLRWCQKEIGQVVKITASLNKGQLFSLLHQEALTSTGTDRAVFQLGGKKVLIFRKIFSLNFIEKLLQSSILKYSEVAI